MGLGCAFLVGCWPAALAPGRLPHEKIPSLRDFVESVVAALQCSFSRRRQMDEFDVVRAKSRRESGRPQEAN
jgi:hypothetical protein